MFSTHVVCSYVSSYCISSTHLSTHLLFICSCFLFCSLFVNVVYYNTHLLLFLFDLFIIVVCFLFFMRRLQLPLYCYLVTYLDTSLVTIS